MAWLELGRQGKLVHGREFLFRSCGSLSHSRCGSSLSYSESLADAQLAAHVTDAQVVLCMVVYGFECELPWPLGGYEWYPYRQQGFYTLLARTVDGGGATSACV